MEEFLDLKVGTFVKNLTGFRLNLLVMTLWDLSPPASLPLRVSDCFLVDFGAFEVAILIDLDDFLVKLLFNFKVEVLVKVFFE